MKLLKKVHILPFFFKTIQNNMEISKPGVLFLYMVAELRHHIYQLANKFFKTPVMDKVHSGDTP